MSPVSEFVAGRESTLSPRSFVCEVDLRLRITRPMRRRKSLCLQMLYVHLARAYSKRCDLLERLQDVLEKLSRGTGRTSLPP